MRTIKSDTEREIAEAASRDELCERHYAAVQLIHELAPRGRTGEIELRWQRLVKEMDALASISGILS